MRLADYANARMFIGRLTARSILTEEEIDAILDLPAIRQAVSARNDFTPLDEAMPDSCLIIGGLVARYGQTQDGKRQITALHMPGDMADLLSIVRPVGVGLLHALSDVEILRVPHTAMRALAAQYSAISEAFWRDCMLDMAVLMQWMVNLGRRDAQTRLAHLLCETATRYARGQEPLLNFAFPISQEQLADATGLTSVHVNRSLRALAKEGLVTMKHKFVQIADWHELASVGEFSGAYLEADTTAEQRRRLLAFA